MVEIETKLTNSLAFVIGRVLIIIMRFIFDTFISSELPENLVLPLNSTRYWFMGGGGYLRKYEEATSNWTRKPLSVTTTFTYNLLAKLFILNRRRKMPKSIMKSLLMLPKRPNHRRSKNKAKIII